MHPLLRLEFTRGVCGKPVLLMLLSSLAAYPIVLSTAWFGWAAFETQATDCSSDPPPPDRDPQFFPTGTFGGPRWFLAGLYACHLRNMREAPLPSYLSSAQPQAFRLLLQPPFRPALAIRLDVNHDGSGELAVKAEERGHDAVVPNIDRVEPATKPDVDRFTSSLRARTSG